MNKKTILNLLNRLLFVLLSTIVMVFFSEKTFWYVQGYAIAELVLFYAVPVAVCLWTIDAFHVQRFSGVILVGALFGFLVEGVLTPVIYEAGLLDPVMPAYFIGWHGLLSLVLGWFLIRRWLIEEKWKNLLISGVLFGLFWGLWSLPYRLPESVQDFTALVNQGENFIPGAWPIPDYVFYTVVFTGMLMAGHWLLGRGFWQKSFKMNKWEIGIIFSITVGLFWIQVFPIMPQAILKLAVLIALVLVPLWIQKKQGQREVSILDELEGSIRFSQTLPLLIIPFMASFIYALAEVFPPSDGFLETIFISFSTLQGLIGASFFIWAWVDSVRRIY